MNYSVLTKLILKFVIRCCLRKQTVLLVLDPLGDRHSVQLEVIRTIVESLISKFDVTVFSSTVSEKIKADIEGLGAHIVSPAKRFSVFNTVLKVLNAHNESMLWLGSWIAESLFRRNSYVLSRSVNLGDYNLRINMTNSTILPCDIWWNQGYPLYHTLDLSKENYSPFLRVFYSVSRRIFKSFDWKMLLSQKKISKLIVCCAISLADYYRSHGFQIDEVIYPIRDLSRFVPSNSCPTQDYVLTYIGKETEFRTLMRMADSGIPIISFGSKVPVGMNLKGTLNRITHLGHVSEERLIDLYGNALFTAFSFTNEQFGFIPLESMACGTPVLTYGREGPGETVINNETGWLVNNCHEFEKQAIELWRSRDALKIDRSLCRKRAMQFDRKQVGEKLNNLFSRILPEVPYHENPS